ncbi:E3 ubiquitin-protein ligase siah2-like [Centruroides sculpturatus]|uniref:E3 ubiquitin-protein ligase siah2-like n=1 Tax=Centruroides sculpturatus TaxID=218467 RepID=UPI000C6EA79A|nr:E3 ubiquitin-protein ligase siah2-like [Centruroides sculpturatus]
MASSDQEVAITALLSCPVCLTTVRPPVSQCTNGHMICSQCRPRISTCPTCRETLGQILSLLAEQLASSLRFPCTNSAFGCSELLNELDREGHESLCPHQPLSCPLSHLDCVWEGTRPNLLSHISQANPQVPHLQQSFLNFLGVHADDTLPKSWAVVLECHLQQFLILVTKQQPDNPTFLINVYLLSDQHHSSSPFTYFIAFKRGPNTLDWKSSHIPLWGFPNSQPFVPLTLPANIVYSFCAHDNFKFFCKISTH